MTNPRNELKTLSSRTRWIDRAVRASYWGLDSRRLSRDDLLMLVGWLMERIDNLDIEIGDGGRPIRSDGSCEVVYLHDGNMGHTEGERYRLAIRRGRPVELVNVRQ